MGKCKCQRRARIVSDAVRGMGNRPDECHDVCENPICGEPKMLSLMAPVIYDEIGINLCTTFDLGVDITEEYPTVVKATIRVIGANYVYGDDNVEIEALTGRPNCYGVTLSNIEIDFAMNLYDCGGRLVDTIYPTALYLPPDETDPGFDEDTNPSSVELEIFAPYGYSYEANGGDPTPVVNFLGFTDDNNYLRQGLNLQAMAKLLDFDIDDSTVTVGITLVLQSVYYAGYKVESAGRIETPKGSIVSPETSDCMEFVAGDLLNLEIKPLNLGSPKYEERLKNECDNNSCGNSSVSDTSTSVTAFDC